MGCKFSDFNGRCEMAGCGIEIGGCNEEGYCVVEDDEYPSYSCESYNSDEEDFEE